MKSNCNCVVCFGFLILLGGSIVTLVGMTSIPGYLEDPESYGSFLGVTLPVGIVIFSIITIIGLVMTTTQLSAIKKWNKVVAIAKSQNEITMKEASVKVGVTPEKAQEIIYEAIASGELLGTIHADTFTRSKTAAGTTVVGDAKVLVICPYCGAKTEQGLAKCQNCKADL